MKFKETYIGQKSELSHLITIDDINKFIELTGDKNKLHVDVEYGKQTQFGSTIVHGIFTASFISTLIGTQLPGNGTLWKSQTLKFIYPVVLNDTIIVRGEIIKRDIGKKELTMITDIYNQNNNLVILGTAIVKMFE
jgi:3-oxoacyl-[acyl-carrier protein] reductase